MRYVVSFVAATLLLGIGCKHEATTQNSAASARVQDDPEMFALDEGAKVREERARELKAHLVRSPGDVEARLLLLGYFFANRMRDDAPAEHILWFVENDPSNEILAGPLGMPFSPQLNPQITTAWKKHLDKPSADPAALLNGARFFSLSSPEQSVAYLEKGEKLRPEWATWANELGTLAMREVGVALESRAIGRKTIRPTLSDQECRERAAVALKHFERALSKCADRFSLLPDAAEAAFVAGDHLKTVAYADEILESAIRNSSNRHWRDYVHTAYIFKGRVALSKGDVASAARSLIDAGKIGSKDAPVLRSFGPDFALAREMLDRGESTTVLAYLAEVERYWNPERVALWRDAMAKGEHPALTHVWTPDLP